MTTTEPTPEAVEELARVIDAVYWETDNAYEAARAVLAAGYVKPDWAPLPEDVTMHTMAFISHNDQRMCGYHARLGKWTFEGTKECLRDHPTMAQIMACAPGEDDDEHIDDTDLCEHGLRFGCADCKPGLHRLMSNPPAWGDGS